MPDDEQTFFEKERDRLSAEIASGFEHLLTNTNVLNRKLEEVTGMTKEYPTIANLWSRFHLLMLRSQPSSGGDDHSNVNEEGEGENEESLVVPLHSSPAPSDRNAPHGLPGTGGYILQVPPSAKKVAG